MIRCVVLSFVLLSTFVSNASADIPPPPGHKRVNPRVCFEGIDKHADHIFYLQLDTFRGGPGPPPNRLVQVIDSDPFSLSAGIPIRYLLALERKEFEQRWKDDPSSKWLNNETDGVKAASVTAPPTIGKTTDKEVPVTVYRVASRTAS